MRRREFIAGLGPAAARFAVPAIYSFHEQAEAARVLTGRKSTWCVKSSSLRLRPQPSRSQPLCSRNKNSWARPKRPEPCSKRAVAAVKADRDVALGMFNKGEGGFKDRDLYPFCHRVADGKIVAGPTYVLSGTDVRTLKDAAGKEYGGDSYAAAQKPEGQITELSYMAPKPGTTAPAFPKVSFVTRVGDLNCGVGYFIR
jgi:hypothetical protein